jgi:tetratricopeptide (TPR) repeat protein
LVNDSITKLDEANGDKAEIERLTEERNDAYRLVIEDFTVVTRLDPGDYEAWYFLGACNYFLEQYEGARDAWEQAAVAKPEAVEVWQRLAPLYLRLGDTQKSKEAEKKLEELTGG